MARILTEETTLNRQIDRLNRETTFLEKLWLYELGLGGAILFIGLVAGLLSGNWITAAVGGALAFLGAGHGMKRRENDADAGRFVYGSQGEAEVTKVLQRGLPDDYLILNDISVSAGMKKAQNDHLVIGPNGIFIIETKAYSGRITGEASEDTLEQTKEWQGKRTTNRIKNPIPQNEYHRQVVAEFLTEFGYPVDDLFSLIVFTSKWSRIEIRNAEVPVVRPNGVVAAIRRQEAKYAYDEAYRLQLAELFAPGCTAEKPAPPPSTKPAAARKAPKKRSAAVEHGEDEEN